MEFLSRLCEPTFRGSRVAFIGEAPGGCEVGECNHILTGPSRQHSLEGFVGPAGRVLDRILFSGGLTREDVDLNNVVKERPPENDFGFFYESVKEGKRKVTRPSDRLKYWIERLGKELQEHRPNLVVACGAETTEILCGVKGITHYRGSVLPSTLVPGLKVIPITHPALVIQSAQWQELYVSSRIVREKVVPESKFPEIRRLPWVRYSENVVGLPFIERPPSLALIGKFFTEAQGHRWCLDLEIRGRTIACVGLGFSPQARKGDERVLIVPIQTTSGSAYSPREELEFWRMFAKFANGNPLLVGQNLMYDLDWLLTYGVECEVYMDTMLGFHSMYPELPKKLEFLTMLYDDQIYYKEEGKTWGSKTVQEDLHNYCTKDVVTTLRVSWGIERDPRWKFVKDRYFGYTSRLIPPSLEMQKEGFEVDAAALKELSVIAERELKENYGRLVALVGRKVNVGSPKQVHELLKERGFKLKVDRKSGGETADEDALVELMVKNPKDDVIRLLLAIRKWEKLLSSYVNIELVEE